MQKVYTLPASGQNPRVRKCQDKNLQGVPGDRVRLTTIRRLRRRDRVKQTQAPNQAGICAACAVVSVAIRDTSRGPVGLGGRGRGQSLTHLLGCLCIPPGQIFAEFTYISCMQQAVDMGLEPTSAPHWGRHLIGIEHGADHQPPHPAALEGTYSGRSPPRIRHEPGSPLPSQGTTSLILTVADWASRTAY